MQQLENNMPTTRLRKEKRREQILGTACRLFAEKGYDAVTTKELAQAIYCSEALIFRYFPTKNSIFQALFDEWKDGETDPFSLEIIEGSAIKTLEFFFYRIAGNQVWDKPGQRPYLQRAVYSRTDYTGNVMAILANSPDIVSMTLVPVVEMGMRKGEIRSGDSFQIALSYWTMLTGIRYLNTNYPGRYSSFTFDIVRELLKCNTP